MQGKDEVQNQNIQSKFNPKRVVLRLLKILAILVIYRENDLNHIIPIPNSLHPIVYFFYVICILLFLILLFDGALQLVSKGAYSVKPWIFFGLL